MKTFPGQLQYDIADLTICIIMCIYIYNTYTLLFKFNYLYDFIIVIDIMLNNNKDMAVICYMSGYATDKAYGTKKCEECKMFIMSEDKIELEIGE